MIYSEKTILIGGLAYVLALILIANSLKLNLELKGNRQ